jgi:hypothetical protein
MTKTLLIPERDLAEELAPGTYTTDGRRLYRVVSRFSDTCGRPFAALEDCLTLEVVTHTPDELYAMGLRQVLPEGD